MNSVTVITDDFFRAFIVVFVEKYKVKFWGNEMKDIFIIEAATQRHKKSTEYFKK